MDSNDLRQILQAQIAAYTALVNTLKVADSIDVHALTQRLNHYAEMMEAGSPIASQMLIAQASAISGDALDITAIEKMLH